MFRDFLPVPILECTIAQPVCNGVKANSYKHLSPATAVGEKRAPSNEENDEITAEKGKSGGNSNEATSTTFATSLLLSLAAVAITATSVF